MKINFNEMFVAEHAFFAAIEANSISILGYRQLRRHQHVFQILSVLFTDNGHFGNSFFYMATDMKNIFVVVCQPSLERRVGKMMCNNEWSA